MANGRQGDRRKPGGIVFAFVGVITVLLVTHLTPSLAAGVTVTVTPNSGLHNNDNVHVQASGVPPNHASVQVVECIQGATDSSQCDGNTLDVSGDSDGNGNYDNPAYPVHTLATANNDSINCDANNPCEIWVGVDYNNAFASNSGTANISFAGSGTTTTTTTTGSTTTTTTGSTTTTTTSPTSTTTTTTTTPPSTTSTTSAPTSSSSSTTSTTGPAATTTTTVAPTLASLSGDTVAAGFQITIKGSNLPPHQAGTIVLNSTPVTLQTIQTDASGAFETIVRIPASTEPGQHTLVVKVGDAQASLAITVLAPSGSAVTPTPAATPVNATPNFTG